MPVHHDGWKFLFGVQERLFDTQQVVPILLPQRNARAQPRVHEQIVVLAMTDGQCA